MDNTIKIMARTGYVAKGVVYAITGALTFLAAFNMGGQKTGKIEVLEYLDKQTFGNLLLILMGLGLACYATWRFLQSIKDPEGVGRDTKAAIKRGGYFISGVLYLGLAIMAVLRVINQGGGSTGSSGGPQKASFLASETGLILVGIVGAGMVLSGIFQFVKAYRNDYSKKFDLSSLREEKKRRSIKNTSKFGLSSRGVMFLILGYFSLKAAFNSNPSQVKTTSEVFSFIQESSYGAWLLGAVAAGLVAYALYMFLMAKYRRFPATI